MADENCDGESYEQNSLADKFAEMIENSNSYIRTRGIILISVNAKWDIENKIDEIIDDYF